jgi:hypothetical protein
MHTQFFQPLTSVELSIPLAMDYPLDCPINIFNVFFGPKPDPEQDFSTYPTVVYRGFNWLGCGGSIIRTAYGQQVISSGSHTFVVQPKWQSPPHKSLQTTK